MSRSLFQPRWARYGLAVAAVAAGFVSRLALTAWVGPGLPMYITFYPAVMAAALLAGFGPGLLATILTALGVAHWFFEPAGLGVGAPVDRVATAVFVLICLFICEITRRYRRARDEAAAYEREQALRESREALRRQAELIDPIRAELIAQEMQRAVRERGEPRGVSAPKANWLSWAPSAAGASVVTVGVLVLLGWIFNVTALKSVLPGLANMKANAALCFVLTGLALMLRNRAPVRLGCAALLLTVAGATLGEYIAGRDFGLDQLLFRDLQDAHTVYPGRMVPETAMGFVLSSVSLLLVAARSRAARRTQQALAAGTALIGLFALLGYLYSVERMYNFAGPASMALLTSVGLLVAGFGLLSAPPDGWARVLAAGGPGAQLASRFVPVALLLPVTLGWLHRYGELTGWVEPPLGTGLLALAMMLALLAAVWWISQALNRADAARRETEMQLRNQAELIDRAGEALIVRELGGAICSWNRGAELLYGWSAAEAVGQPIHALLRPEPAALVETIETVLAQNGRWDGELAHTTRDGRQLTIDAHETATRTGDGRVLVLESLRDISARKAAETAVRTHAEALERSRRAALNLARDAAAARARAEQAAAELRESEERFRALVEASSDAVYRMNPDWTEMRHLVGRQFIADTEEPSRTWLQKYVRPEDQPHLMAVIAEAIRAKSVFELVHRVLRVDGSLGWTFSRAIPMLDARGEITEWFGMAKDITERKRAEEQLDRSRKTFAELVERAPFGIYIVDSQFRIAQMNAGSQSGAFRNVRPVIGRDFAEAMRILWPESVASGIITVLRHTLETGEPYYSPPFINPRQDVGTTEAYEWELHRIMLPDGRYGVICYYFDSTKLREAEAATRASEERLRLAQNAARIGVWDWNLRSGEVRCTPELEAIFGLEPGSVRVYEDFSQRVHPEDRTLMEAGWKEAIAQRCRFATEFRVLQPGGKLVWIHSRGAATYDEAGAAVQLFGVSLDITERRLVEQEREERDRRKDEFLALLGHELRNPLAAISTAMYLLSNGVTAEHRDALEQLMDRQVGVLRRLVDDLLDLARITHGHIELQKERLDLSDVLQRASVAVRSSLASRRQELVVRMPAGYVRFMADSVRMEQIVTNLLSNASKYTHEGGRIELSGAREGSEVVIRCKDNGRGIPLGMQRMIFEPFTRVQKAGPGDAEGIGLGLALVKRIADLHGGTVSVESAGAGAGSEFTVRLPLVEPPADARETKPVPSPQVRRSLSVVLVEDNPDVVQTMIIALEQAGHHVTVFGDGPSALSGLANLKPDVILLDIGLPGMDGYELAAELKQRKNLQQALYVGLSGYKRRTPAADRKDDFDEYFVKPVELDQLLSLLDARRPASPRASGKAAHKY